jgi:hypothetical protein
MGGVEAHIDADTTVNDCRYELAAVVVFGGHGAR